MYTTVLYCPSPLPPPPPPPPHQRMAGCPLHKYRWQLTNHMRMYKLCSSSHTGIHSHEPLWSPSHWAQLPTSEHTFPLAMSIKPSNMWYICEEGWWREATTILPSSWAREHSSCSREWALLLSNPEVGS